MPSDPLTIDELVETQHGVITRAQIVEAGMSDRWVRHRANTGIWQRAYPGVYIAYSGTADWLTMTSAALLYAGPGAALSHATASDWWFETEGTRQQRRNAPVEISIPARRTLTPKPGLVVHRRRLMPRVFPGKVQAISPDETVVDLVQQADSADDIIAILARASKKVVHPDAILLALGRRARVRGRALVAEMLGEVAVGVESPLELRYRGVERVHRLPASELQVREKLGERWIRADCRYRRYRVRVELDGQLAHPGGRTDQDTWRDNESLLATDELTLRYRWSHVAGSPCNTAAQVVRALRKGGWRGTPRPCGPDCDLHHD